MAKKKQIKSISSVAALSSKYAGAGMVDDVMPKWEDILWVPSSSPVVNYYLGGGGAYGRIMEISGKESSGKTLLALDLIASAQKLGGMGIFVDAELAFHRDWAKLNGVDPAKLMVYPENTLELVSDFVAESCYYWRSQLTHNEPIVLVVDSVAALDTQASMSASEVDAKEEMGIRAKKFYKMLRVRNKLWSRLGITVIFINQLRDKINTGFASRFEDKVTTVGGNALKFYASQRLYLEAKKQLTSGSKDNKLRYGVEVSMTMKKNKLAIPKSPGRISVIFDPEHGDLGFDRWEGLDDIVIREGGLEKNGASYSFEGKTVANARSAIIPAFEDDDFLMEDVLYKCRIVTIESMQDRLDDLTENLYPVDGITFATGSGSDEEDEDGEEDE